MSFYQSISPFLEYLHSIRKLESYLSFDMTFPTKWSLPKSIVNENQVVGFQIEDENKKGISFVSTIETKSVETTIKIISKIIKYNKEKEIKEKLFKETVEKLKSTFEQNNLDKLQNLYFDFSTEVEDTSNLDTYDAEQSENIELAEE